MAAFITRAGSKQTYYTFLLLADRDRVQDALRAYAYFRWLDDCLDCSSGAKQEKINLLERQQALLERIYRREEPGEVSPEEQMLVDLVHNDQEEHSGMQIYLRNMMAVMSFDVERCGRVISIAELTKYTFLLSSAVTEILFYLIGHKNPPPSGDARYHAVSGAHIVHMLRDTLEDISAGYFNIPAEFISANQLSKEVLSSLPFRQWVHQRVALARQNFSTGRKYIARVKNLRCRLAGFAYLARFEWMLRMIERDGYYLRMDYPGRKSIQAAIWMAYRVLASALNLPGLSSGTGNQAAFLD